MPKTNNWHVVTGGPSSGKTTLLAELEKFGHTTIPEAARAIIDAGLAKGLSLEQIRRDEMKFQIDVLRQKIHVEKNHDPSLLTFLDRGIHDSLAYIQLYAWEVADEVKKAVSQARYQQVFLLDPLPVFDQDYARTESPEMLQKLHDLLYKAYDDQGMTPVSVPVLPPQERAQFVLQRVNPNLTID